MIAQVTAVVACLWLVATDMRRGGVPDAPAALVLMLTAFAAAPALLVVRSQLFSLAFFPLLVLLLREEARATVAPCLAPRPAGRALVESARRRLARRCRRRRVPALRARCAGTRSSPAACSPGWRWRCSRHRRSRRPPTTTAASWAARRRRVGEGLWQPLSLPLAVRSSSSSPWPSRSWCSRCARGPRLWEFVVIVGARICGSTGEPERGLAGALHRASGRAGAGRLAVVAADGAEERRDRGDRPARPPRDRRAGADARLGRRHARAAADGRARRERDSDPRRRRRRRAAGPRRRQDPDRQPDRRVLATRAGPATSTGSPAGRRATPSWRACM